MGHDDSFELFVKFVIGIILIFAGFVVPTYGDYYFLLQIILGFAGFVVILTAVKD